MASDFDSFITADLVMGRASEEIEPQGRLMSALTLPARAPIDRDCVARALHLKDRNRRGLDTMEVAGLVAKIIREDKPVKVNIDIGGLGVGVYDRLVEQGYGDNVYAVNFGGKPIEPPPLDENGKPAGGPANRRAEMYVNLRNALEGEISLPDSTALQGDLTSIGYKFTSDGKLLLESKEDMRRRGVPSPDEGDAVALCFTEPNGSPVPRSIAMNFNRKIEYPEFGHRLNQSNETKLLKFGTRSWCIGWKNRPGRPLWKGTVQCDIDGTSSKQASRSSRQYCSAIRLSIRGGYCRDVWVRDCIPCIFSHARRRKRFVRGNGALLFGRQRQTSNPA